MKTHIPKRNTGKTYCGRDSERAFTDSWARDSGETCQKCNDNQAREKEEQRMNEVRRKLRNES